jgi:anaerobic selenocysteine-containing dehydrogenase
MNGTMEQADLPVMVKPGTDGALACAVMHCLFRDGKADWDYLERYTDARARWKRICARAIRMGVAITGCPVETIEEFARLVGATKRAYFRLGYGFSRSRNGPSTCTRQAASRRSPAPGCTRAAARSTTTPTSIIGTSR